jgi:hypothetical protein
VRDVVALLGLLGPVCVTLSPKRPHQITESPSRPISLRALRAGPPRADPVQNPRPSLSPDPTPSTAPPSRGVTAGSMSEANLRVLNGGGDAAGEGDENNAGVGAESRSAGPLSGWQTMAEGDEMLSAVPVPLSAAGAATKKSGWARARVSAHLKAVRGKVLFKSARCADSSLHATHPKCSCWQQTRSLAAGGCERFVQIYGKMIPELIRI